MRVDHFRGFDAYYSIPAKDKTAEFGHWEKGPGYELFKAMKKRFGKLPIIAEDLGFLTPSVLKLVKKTGFPGMKVLEFAFDASGESSYLPHRYPKNCVAVSYTHLVYLIGRYIGASPKKGDSYSWVPNHLQDANGDLAPRSFLKCYACAAKVKMCIRDSHATGIIIRCISEM